MIWSPAGSKVVGVDAGRVAAGAAGRNGGFLLGGAAAYLHDAIARWGTEPAVALYRATLDELSRLADTARAGRGPARRLDPARRAAGSAV